MRGKTNATAVSPSSGAINKATVNRPVVLSIAGTDAMSKQGKVRIPRDLVYSIAELAQMLGITESEARNRCAAGLVRGAFKSSDGMMSRWWVFKAMYDSTDQLEQPAPFDPESLAEQIAERLSDKLQIVVSARRGGA